MTTLSAIGKRRRCTAVIPATLPIKDDTRFMRKGYLDIQTDATSVGKIVAVLTEARNHLKEFGWCRQTFVNATNIESAQTAPCCTLGAINWAVTKNPRSLHDPLARQGWSALADTLTLWGWDAGMVGWNDVDSRTINDVMRLYDETIDRLTNSQ